MLKVTEIYTSVQGESIYAGWPCVFVRLTGCPLRCKWCDTVYSFEGGEDQSVEDLVTRIAAEDVKMIELTGGEPLAQPECLPLMERLVEEGFQVLIETGGSEPIENVDHRVHIIMDLKCPDSGMSDRNHWQNLEHLKPTDEIKFVVASRNDFDWAVDTIREHKLEDRVKLAISPAFGHVKEEELVTWLLASKVSARLNMQIHKYIWSPRKKGV